MNDPKPSNGTEADVSEAHGAPGASESPRAKNRAEQDSSGSNDNDQIKTNIDSSSVGPSRIVVIATCLALALAILAVYWPVAEFDFIHLDDPVHVSQNENISAGLTWRGLQWSFGVNHWAWHPLTFITHMLDSAVYGLEWPGGHHLTNVLLHAINAVLLLLVIYRMTGAFWRSAILAALFALHPLRVESVVWIAERKDVLMCLFGLLAIGAYLHYARKPSILRYAGFALLFTASLMSKLMFMTLPLALILLDYWPLGRIRGHAPTSELLNSESSDLADANQSDQAVPHYPQRSILYLIAEKLPLFVPVTVITVLTISGSAKLGRIAQIEPYPIGTRLANVVVSYVRYLEATFWPHDLALLYPFPPSWPILWVLGSCIILMAISAAAIWQWKRRPYFAVGWFWFLGTLAPVIGFFQLGAHARADRFTYVPSIGLLLALVWLIGDYAESIPKAQRIRLVLVAFIASLLLGITSFKQLQHWRDTPTLYTHTLKVTKSNYKVRYWYGNYLAGKGQYNKAIEQFLIGLKTRPDDRATNEELASVYGKAKLAAQGISLYQQRVTDNPDDAMSHYCLGLLYGYAHRSQMSEQHFQEVIRIDPKHAKARYQIAGRLFAQGKLDDALYQLNTALRDSPRSANVHYALGLIYRRKEQPQRAAAYFQQAIEINPRLTQPMYDLADLRITQNKLDEAMALLRRAMSINPKQVKYTIKLAEAMALNGQVDQAVQLLRQAQLIEPKNPTIQARWAKILFQAGRLDEAINVCRRRLELGINRADVANAHNDLGVIYRQLGQSDKAIEQFKAALKVNPRHKSAQKNLESLNQPPPSGEKQHP